MSTTFRRQVAQTVLAVGASTVLSLSLVSTATATETAARDGVCDVGEFCLYYLSNLGGSLSDFDTSIPNYGDSQPSCYEFKGPGEGQGQCVKNNAQSAWNRRNGMVYVYFNSNYSGASDSVPGGQSRNLSATSDENACHKFA